MELGGNLRKSGNKSPRYFEFNRVFFLWYRSVCTWVPNKFPFAYHLEFITMVIPMVGYADDKLNKNL